MRFDPTLIAEWQTASKTSGIRVKHVSAIADSAFAGHLRLMTIEGLGPLRNDTVICMGRAGDVWLQSATKVFNEYTAIVFSFDGWLNCEPKPENEVFCYEVPFGLFGENRFQLIGMWGETLPDGTQNIQNGVGGDFVCRSRTNPADLWIVRRDLFLNTYEIK